LKINCSNKKTKSTNVNTLINHLVLLQR